MGISLGIVGYSMGIRLGIVGYSWVYTQKNFAPQKKILKKFLRHVIPKILKYSLKSILYVIIKSKKVVQLKYLGGIPSDCKLKKTD